MKEMTKKVGCMHIRVGKDGGGRRFGTFAYGKVAGRAGAAKILVDALGGKNGTCCTPKKTYMRNDKKLTTIGGIKLRDGIGHGFRSCDGHDCFER